MVSALASDEVHASSIQTALFFWITSNYKLLLLAFWGITLTATVHCTFCQSPNQRYDGRSGFLISQVAGFVFDSRFVKRAMMVCVRTELDAAFSICLIMRGMVSSRYISNSRV